MPGQENNMFDLRARKNGRPLLVGHRGAMAVAPENTLHSFNAALTGGADLIELDVQLSKDKEIMVVHDYDLGYKTGKSGRVDQFTAEELRAMDMGGHFSPEFAGAQMPFLDEILTWAKGRMGLMIEFKHEPPIFSDKSLEARTIAMVRDHGMEDEVVFISFDQFSLQRAKDIAPEIATSFVYIARVLDPIAQLSGLKVDALSPATNFMTPDEVKRIQAAGLACSPGGLWWDYKVLLEWGVDTVSANDPASINWDEIMAS
jgi:glycerophosphoryl diester phosphodiesterase